MQKKKNEKNENKKQNKTIDILSFHQNSIRHTLSIRKKFIRLPRLMNGSPQTYKSWWGLNSDAMCTRSSSEADHSDQEDQYVRKTDRATQTEN